MLQVQLSCYADAIGGGLPDLRHFIDEHLEGEHPSAPESPMFAKGLPSAAYQQLTAAGFPREY
jgi:hypothetical protein